MRYYQHVKTGNHYKVLAEGRIEASLDPVVIYQNIEQPEHVWVRPRAEFYDGRFQLCEDVGGAKPVNMLQDIGEFYHRFGLTYTGRPRALPLEFRQFRGDLLCEELNEYHLHSKAALEEIISDYKLDDGEYTNALEGMLDALVDLVYVALGNAHLHGFDFEEAWRRVHQANMKKVRAERADQSKRKSQFDVIKPPGWEPPSHRDLVERHDLRKDVE